MECKDYKEDGIFKHSIKGRGVSRTQSEERRQSIQRSVRSSVELEHDMEIFKR